MGFSCSRASFRTLLTSPTDWGDYTCELLSVRCGIGGMGSIFGISVAARDMPLPSQQGAARSSNILLTLVSRVTVTHGGKRYRANQLSIVPDQYM